MLVEVFHPVAGGAEIFTWVELGGFLGQGLSDGSGHSQAAVAVDVYLAHSALRSLTQLLFGNTHCLLQGTAVGVDDVHILLWHRARAVQHDGESRQFLFDGFQHVECQRRRQQTARLRVNGALFGGELVGAVARSNRDGERIDARLGYEIYHLFGFGVVALGGRHLVLHSGQHAQLAFDGHVVLVGEVNHLAGQGHVLVVGEGRAVDHHRAETRLDAVLAELEAVAVVEVQHYLGVFATQLFGILHSAFGHIAQKRLVGVVAGTLRHLQYHGRLGLHGCHDNGLQLLHVVEVECRDGIAAVNGFGEHSASVHQSYFFVVCHDFILLCC